MKPKDNTHEQKENLEEMNYSSKDDIFNQEEHISLDGNGDPITVEKIEESDLDENLDVPGADADDDMEEIGSEDEENNYYSLSDNEDDHEEENEDLLS
ncbi:hypothetical protein Q73A0000_02825 [Kaistella flava (ex Peng et al. 2021)]|uniref:Uncharacterized protein n=1 Tax=Kaistella flava (ex Peng et al. 2021) TaxID=2038776 RepID=A0A7M2Y5K1_9FLAO|nr:hypothetical protein [Kaistella flava (ex Peng et al. 2021)]QOW09366.1 hypothetical protein Q73A0000_02825 [Kaistella flava (ex Peng et al. 2021)]